jgi:hypothetical protein
LFGSAEDESTPPKKPRRMLRGDEYPATVSIVLPADGRRAECSVVVKRPEHQCDRVAIPIVPDVIDHVLLVVHLAGFDEDSREPARPTDTPKGVWWNKQQ